MSILTKDIIIKEILPHLSQASTGRKLSENKLVGIVQLILHRLKTGTQWRELPIKQFMDEPYSWKSVFHHFNKWSKDNSWQNMWISLVSSHREFLDMSSIQIDGTHTPAKGGGDTVAYQSRKSCKTSNMLCISDANGVLLMASQPEAGNHHDLFDIESHFQEIVEMADNAEVSLDGLFLNGDAGFDSAELRDICFKHGIIPNFCLNKRNGNITDRDEHFDQLLYKQRTVIEHAFAWLDAFKALLVRFEKTTRNWFNLNIIGFAVILLRKITSNKL